MAPTTTMPIEVFTVPRRPRRATFALLAALMLGAGGSHIDRADHRAERDAAADRCTRCHKKNWDCRCRRT